MKISYAIGDWIRQLSAFAAVAWLVGMPSGAFCQAADHDAQPTYLDDITVSGQRITDQVASVGILNELAIKDSPISIRAISSDLIENVFARTVTDTVKTDASVSTSSTAGSYADFIQIRGFPSGVLVDGVFANSTDQPFPVDTLERVEILKGVSTFLAGATPSTGTAGPGGTVNLITKRATRDFAGTLKAEFNEKSHFKGLIDVGDTFEVGDGSLGARFIGSYENGKQSIDRNDDRRSTAYIAIDWRPTNSLTLSADALYLNDTNRGYQDVVIVEPGFQIPAAPDANNNLKPWSYWHPDTQIAKGRAVWNFAPDWKLTGTIAYARNNSEYLTPSYPTITNSNGLLSSNAIYSGSGVTETFTVDARLNGKLETGRLTHKIGLGYNRTRAKRAQFYYEYLEPYEGLISPILSNIYQPVYSSYDIPSFILRDGRKAVDTISVQSSFFVNDIVSILEDRLSLLAGIRRVTFNDTSYNYECVVSNVLDSSYCKPGAIASAPAKTSKGTPSFSIFGKPTDRSLLYASYAEQLEQGGQAGVEFANANENLPPISSKQYEVGAKFSLVNSTITLALFNIDRQLQFVDPNTNVFDNFGSQVNRGAELVVEGKLADGLVANVGVTYIDASLKETGDAAVDGNKMTGVPAWTATLFADYAFPSIAGLAVNGTLTYSTSQYYDLDNSRRIPSFVVADFGARYQFDLGQKKMTINGYVSNLFNKNYWATASGDGFQALGKGQARTLNLGLAVDF